MQTCKANDCPCVGTLKGLCRYHSDADSKDWGYVTEKLKKNVRLLTAIGWSMTVGRQKDNETARTALTRLTGEYPELEPRPEESAMTWAYRAIAWLSREVRPVRNGNLMGNIRISDVRKRYFPKTIEEFKEAAE